MYFVSYTTTRENTNTVERRKYAQKQCYSQRETELKAKDCCELQLHCTRPALSQYCKIFKGLQRDENIAKYTSTHNKRERMATDKRRKADTCQKKQQRHQNGQIRKRPNHSLLKLPQTHRLHFFIACKRRCNAISTETITTKPVKQQSNFTTRKQSYTKPAPLA